jgi:hypothetical protein
MMYACQIEAALMAAIRVSAVLLGILSAQIA